MASHEISKLVDGSGDEFNFRDPTKESLANKVTSVRASSSATDTNYPSEKAVASALASKLNTSDVDAELSTTSTNPLQNKELTRWMNIIIGDDGFVSGSAANPQLSLFKSRLGALSLYNAGVNIKIYSFDENDEENAVLEWDSSTADESVKADFNRGVSTGTLYQSEAGKWVKVVYTGSASSYFRALGIFMDTKNTSSSVKSFYGRLRAIVSGTTVEYPWSGSFSTWGSLVTVAYSKSSITVAEIILKPSAATCKCRIYGFRCLNTYSSDDAILIGRSSSAFKLATARKLKTKLDRTSASTFDGSADQENIPVTGTLPVGNGGTGKSSVTSGNYLVGNGTSALTEKTPKTVGNNVLAALDEESAAFSTDDAVIITGDSAAANTTTFYRRKVSYIWTWIQSKISSVLGLSTTGYTGNAATATKAAQDGSGNTIDGTYKKHSTADNFTVPQVIDDNSRTEYQSLRIGNKFKRISVGITGAGNVNISEMTGRDNSPSDDKSIIYTLNGGTKYYFNGNAATASALEDDSGYVHITGSETITGAKEFSRSGLETNFTDSSGHDSIVRARTTTNSTLGSCQLDADRDGGKFGVYARNVSGTEKWVASLDNGGVVNLGSSGDDVRIGGKKFVFDASQLGTESNTFYWV